MTRRRISGSVGLGGGAPDATFSPRRRSAEPKVLEIGEGDARHQCVSVQAGPGSSFECAEPEFLPELLMGLRTGVRTTNHEIVCRPAFALYADLCNGYAPERVASICWIDAGQIEEAARLIWHARPVSYCGGDCAAARDAEAAIAVDAAQCPRFERSARSPLPDNLRSTLN